MKMNIKQNSTKLAVVAGILVGSAGFNLPVFANDEVPEVPLTDTMLVSAGVGKNCVITAGEIKFGSYDPIVTNATDPLEATGTIFNTCTIGTAGEIIINYGINGEEGSTDRQMVGMNTDGVLPYEIRSDSKIGPIWSGEEGQGIAVAALGTAEEMTVYASIPGGENVPNDSYTDTLTVTVVY